MKYTYASNLFKIGMGAPLQMNRILKMVYLQDLQGPFERF